MEVTKCFAAFIAISKNLLCYTAQPEPTPSDPKCNHILQSDMKGTVVNKSTTRLFWKKCPFCKESQRKVNQWIKKKNPTYLFKSWILWRFHEEYYNKFRWSEIAIWIWKIQISWQRKSAIATNVDCNLHKSQSQNPRTLPFSMMPTPTHFHTFKHVSLMNLNRNPSLFPFKWSFGTNAQTEI